MTRRQAEAQRYADYIKAEEILRKAIAEANKGWVPDWNTNIRHTKILVCLSSKSELGTISYVNFKLYPNFMYIKSHALAKKLMNTYKQEFITYLSY